MLIASIDAHSMGEYFNYAFDWQYGMSQDFAFYIYSLKMFFTQDSVVKLLDS